MAIARRYRYRNLKLQAEYRKIFKILGFNWKNGHIHCSFFQLNSIPGKVETFKEIDKLLKNYRYVFSKICVDISSFFSPSIIAGDRLQ